MTFYDKSGKSLQASAPRAVAVEAKQTLTLYDGVTTTTSTWADHAQMPCRWLLRSGRTTGTLHGMKAGYRILRTADGYQGTGNRFDSDITLED